VHEYKRKHLNTIGWTGTICNCNNVIAKAKAFSFRISECNQCYFSYPSLSSSKLFVQNSGHARLSKMKRYAAM
jgi:hypothetical protein